MARSVRSSAPALAGDNARVGWRKHLPVHPAADLFPPMSEDELRELGNDIKENGQRVQVVLWKDPAPGGVHWLIDGRNRLDAMELLGLPVYDRIGRQRFYWRLMDDDPYEVALSLNLLRRNLTDELRRELIAKVIKAKPEKSNRAVAKETGTSEPTVRRVLKELTASGDADDQRTGRAAPRPQAKKKPKPEPAPVERRASGGAEDSIERRAQMAALDPETAAETDEVGKRVVCVMNHITRHAEGLTADDTKRFFADLSEALRMVLLARGIGPARTAEPAQ